MVAHRCPSGGSTVMYSQLKALKPYRWPWCPCSKPTADPCCLADSQERHRGADGGSEHPGHSAAGGGRDGGRCAQGQGLPRHHAVDEGQERGRRLAGQERAQHAPGQRQPCPIHQVTARVPALDVNALLGACSCGLSMLPDPSAIRMNRS